MYRQQGTTLIEVLVTVLVLSIGLLGLGATQMLSLKNANSANQTYMAGLAAYDIAERMRANPLGASAGYYDTTGADNTSTLRQHCDTTTCSASQLAELDLYRWGQLLSASLPSGKGAIAVNDSEATITIFWAEQHTGKNYGEPDSGTETASFQLVAEL